MSSFDMYRAAEEFETFQNTSLSCHRETTQAPMSPKSWGNKIRHFFGFEDPDTYKPPPAIEGKKTLILDLDETLIHSSDFPPHDAVEYFLCGDPQFYVYKRPGLDSFLRMCNEKFDTFIFTFGDRQYAEPVLDTLCPFINQSHRLYRDSCEMKSGTVKKDLGIFHRPKKDLILIDDNSAAMHFNPKNTIMIERWFGIPQDSALIDWLPPILNECSLAEDVRLVISQYSTPRRIRSSGSRKY
ncbi:putative C-terminal domain small phosphatase [Tritrichomonas foetus]|uniref:Mitochondrial import inner membrane translocase subunit TIM50 n=1 Tax=Tritrichomonas foetus TaxID=1144522 RepID=A0A1J4KLA2_9EUKA|nr:putative C-terminal domain small phosphatase [Tritrichomonas foetus]|eukprot:OHT10478.1 putative C-terminal domain small phosphatase [Tritrichomonas foetus]